MYNLAHAYPKKGRNAQSGDMEDYMNKNDQWLRTSNHPKLILSSKPVMLTNKKVIKWAENNLSALTINKLGKASHLMDEDLLNEIGQDIKIWRNSTK